MSIVNIQDVQISSVIDPKNPDRQIAILTYLDRYYELIQTFSLVQLQAAQGLCRYFEDQKKLCTIVKNTQHYSVWVETEIVAQKISADARLREIQALPHPENSRSTLKSADLLTTVFRAQLCLLDGLWNEVKELLGPERAKSFGTDILTSIPSIRSITFLAATIFVAKQLDKSIEISTPTAPELTKLYQDIQLLGRKYLGKNYSDELLKDLQQELPLQLKQEFQAWLERQSDRMT
jgi:hypothetical protein